MPPVPHASAPRRSAMSGCGAPALTAIAAGELASVTSEPARMRSSRCMASMPARFRIRRSAVSPACRRLISAGAVFQVKSGRMPLRLTKSGSSTSTAGCTAMELNTFMLTLSPYRSPGRGAATGRRAASGASRMASRLTAGIGRSSTLQHRVGKLVVAVEAAAQPAAPGDLAAIGMQLEDVLAADRAPSRHGPRPAATAPRAGGRCSRRRRRIPPAPWRAPASARSRSDGATTSEEPGRMRRISAMRRRAFSMAMLPAARWLVIGRAIAVAVSTPDRARPRSGRPRTVCTSVIRSSR